MDCFDRLRQTGIIPVVVLSQAEDAVPTARALLRGGIDVMEITLRTPAAGDAIAAVAGSVPEMLIGAGTVLNPGQCELAVRKGANFLVSPGFNQDMAKWCSSKGIPLIPGCVTPSEIMEAYAMGIRIVKFFPANVYGGLAALKALSGPFRDVRFIPTGGINSENLSDYLCAPWIHAVGGSWICPEKEIVAGNFDYITELCLQARNLVCSARR